MITLLLLVIYIAFIGLGLPDSLLGSAWPAVYAELNIPVGYGSIISILISLGTVSASVFSARLINKFGTGVVTAISTGLSAVCLLGFSFAQSIWWFCLLGVPLGIGAGAIDAALNNYVATHYKSTHMNFLHSFYGVGVSLSPYLMSFALSVENNWRQGYRIVFYIMAGITLITVLAIPLWKKVKAIKTEEEQFTPKTLSIGKMIKTRAIRYTWLLFFSTCALEFTCGIWGCTFLVTAEGMSESLAAKFITFYYLGITAGRLISGFISTKLNQKKIVYIGYASVGVALILIALPIPPIVKGIGLFLIGLGNGPTFPNIIYLTPINFGKEVSQSIVGTQMACCNVGILLMPPLFGLLAQYIGAFLFPYYLIVLYVLMVLSTIIYTRLTKKPLTVFSE